MKMSGSLFITNKDGSVSEGKCELLDKTKFLDNKALHDILQNQLFI